MNISKTNAELNEPFSGSPKPWLSRPKEISMALTKVRRLSKYEKSKLLCILLQTTTI